MALCHLSLWVRPPSLEIRGGLINQTIYGKKSEQMASVNNCITCNCTVRFHMLPFCDHTCMNQADFLLFNVHVNKARSSTFFLFSTCILHKWLCTSFFVSIFCVLSSQNGKNTTCEHSLNAHVVRIEHKRNN